jgi:hypothetical protein
VVNKYGQVREKKGNTGRMEGIRKKKKCKKK